MTAHRTSFASRARTVIVATMMLLLTFGLAGASAQDFTDFKDCLQAGAPWALCTPVFNMPIATPEISLSPSSAVPGLIQYSAASRALTVDGSGSLITYFNSLGNAASITGGALAIRVRMSADGRFLGGSGGACGAGSRDDFCVTGTVLDSQAGKLYGASGPILRGKVAHVGFRKNAILHSGALFDDYEFHVILTGGDLYTNKIRPEMGLTEAAVEVFGYNDGTYAGDHPFGSPSGFSQTYVMAFGGPTNSAGIVFDDKCDGKISGFVTEALNPFAGVPGAEVQLSGAENLVPEASGAYASGRNLCRGTYQLTVLPPAGWIVYGAGSATVTIGKLANGHNSVFSGINFRLYSSPLDASSFMTFRQAEWGTKPSARNAGSLLKTFFDLVYPEEVVIGVEGVPRRYSIALTSAQAVQDFLPQNSRPVPLDRSYVDPASMWKPKYRGRFGTHRRISELAGEVLALELNVRFSVYSITKAGLGSLHVASGPLMGKTVNEVLAIGNSVLGGNPLPAGLKNYDDLEDIIERINRNYEAGAPGKGYLKP